MNRKPQKNLTQTQHAALTMIRARLDARHPGHWSIDPVRAALSGPCRPYLESWVLPLLDMIQYGEQWHDQARGVKEDAARVQRAIKSERAKFLRELGEGS